MVAPKRKYIIYDARGEDDGIAMEVCDTLEEAKQNMSSYGDGCVIYSYELSGTKLINGKREVG